MVFMLTIAGLFFALVGGLGARLSPVAGITLAAVGALCIVCATCVYVKENH